MRECNRRHPDRSCKEWRDNRSCKYGNNCHFRHPTSQNYNNNNAAFLGQSYQMSLRDPQQGKSRVDCPMNQQHPTTAPLQNNLRTMQQENHHKPVQAHKESPIQMQQWPIMPFPFLPPYQHMTIPTQIPFPPPNIPPGSHVLQSQSRKE